MPHRADHEQCSSCHWLQISCNMRSCSAQRCMCCAGAGTYLTELTMNRGVTWEQAKQVLTDFNDARVRDRLPPSTQAGFHIDASIKDWGKTGERLTT